GHPATQTASASSTWLRWKPTTSRRGRKAERPARTTARCCASRTTDARARSRLGAPRPTRDARNERTRPIRVGWDGSRSSWLRAAVALPLLAEALVAELARGGLAVVLDVVRDGPLRAVPAPVPCVRRPLAAVDPHG